MSKIKFFSLLFSCFILIISIMIVAFPPLTLSKINNSSENYDFLTIATAILQNKNSISDPSSSFSTFGYWQLADLAQNDVLHDNFGFKKKEGLVAQIWQGSVNSSSLWTFNLRFFDGNYTDQKEVILRVQTFDNQKGMTINQPNATILVSDLRVAFKDQSSLKSAYYQTDLYIYFVDKATQQPPKTFDTSNLKAYTKQFRFIVHGNRMASEYITSFFDDTYQISQKNKILLIILSLAYIIFSLTSVNLHKANTRPASTISIKVLIFFPIYIISYLIAWFSNLPMSSDLLNYLVPLTFAALLDLGKHLFELYRIRDKDWWWICLYPILTLIFVGFPRYAFYAGDLLSSLYLLPQVILKLQERHNRYKHLTWFEIGNWIWISLWVYYVSFYPQNVFLSSPKPVLIIIHTTTILLQFGVLVFLQCIAWRRRKFRYSFSADQDSQLLDLECSICIRGLEVNSGEKIYKTPCGHFFHPECLESWGKTKLICPVCRAKIPDLAYPID